VPKLNVRSLSDGDLCNEVLKKNREAERELLARVAPVAEGVALANRRPRDVLTNDVVQVVFCKVLKHIAEHEADDVECIEALVRTIANRHMCDLGRKLQREEALEGIVEHGAIDRRDAKDDFDLDGECEC
jgi:DNA-directed RNA polymerase specialized sigma24 family protein